MLRLMGMRRAQAFLLLMLMVSACGSGRVAATSDGSGASASPSPSGEVAVWEVDAGQPPKSGDRVFTAMVARLECASGVTGDVLAPTLVEKEDEVIVTFTVSATTGGGLCPENDRVPYPVELEAPLGTRALVDGACDTTRARTTSECLKPQRWPLDG